MTISLEEHVARAIETDSCLSLPNRYPERWKLYLNEARAAIAAVREREGAKKESSTGLGLKTMAKLAEIGADSMRSSAPEATQLARAFNAWTPHAPDPAEAMRAEWAWAVERWEAEVKNRPLQNVHRRSLDDTWRQVIRHFGGDDVGLCGPSHDDLLTALKGKGEG